AADPTCGARACRPVAASGRMPARSGWRRPARPRRWPGTAGVTPWSDPFRTRGAGLSRGGRLSPLVDEGGDQSRPARLMGGAQPHARVAVEVLVEEDQVAPVRIVLELADGTVDGPAPRLVAREDADHPVGNVLRHLPQGERRPALVFRGGHG